MEVLMVCWPHGLTRHIGRRGPRLTGHARPSAPEAVTIALSPRKLPMPPHPAPRTPIRLRARGPLLLLAASLCAVPARADPEQRFLGGFDRLELRTGAR